MPTGRVYVGHSNTRWVYVISDTAGGIAQESVYGKPRADALLRATPNPFTRRVELVCPGVGDHGTLAVHAADGRLVAALKEKVCPGGVASYRWGGEGPDGKEVPAGVYIAVAGGESLRNGVRMVRMR